MTKPTVIEAESDTLILSHRLVDAKQRLAKVRDDLRDIAGEAQALFDDTSAAAEDLDTTIDTLSQYV